MTDAALRLSSIGPIYIVEDDADVAAIFRQALEAEGASVVVCPTARAFECEAADAALGFAIVDLGLPDANGLTLVSDVLSKRGAPTIVVTGRGGLEDRLAGLDLGADDYLVKPVDPLELMARMRAVLRRIKSAHAAVAPDCSIARFGGWRVDFSRLALFAPDGEELALSHSDAVLLRIFLEAKSRVLSRDFLLEHCGGAYENFDRSIDVRVSRLRKKLRETPQTSTLIRTVYGAGYVFSVPVTWDAGGP